MKKTNKRLIGIILIISLFMCIGYAGITGTTLNITGELGANTQEGVFISEVVVNDASSIVNSYIGTMIDMKTVLGSTSSSTVSYNINLYNNSDKEQVFIGVLTNDYSNANIDYTLTGLTEHETTISKKSSLSFTITFKYAGTNVSNNILESKLNFRFREKPVIELSNEGETYTIENISPGDISEGYEFTVKNYNETETSEVSMDYIFETEITEGPFAVKIYNDFGQEVTESINIEGENQTHKYTLKIECDEENDLEENETYTGKIILKAKPTDTDYEDYEITKEFYLSITVEKTDKGISIKDLPAGTYINYIDGEGNKIPCIILYDTEYNEEHGTNYGIQVITAEPLKDVTLGSDDFEEARASYNSAIETLNNEAMTYLNKDYAIDARCVGSNPADKTLEGEEKDSTEFTKCGVSHGTFKEGDENYIEDYTQMKSLNIDGGLYWFASRYQNELYRNRGSFSNY